jgi:hypothetical protein
MARVLGVFAVLAVLAAVCGCPMPVKSLARRQALAGQASRPEQGAPGAVVAQGVAPGAPDAAANPGALPGVNGAPAESGGNPDGMVGPQAPVPPAGAPIGPVQPGVSEQPGGAPAQTGPSPAPGGPQPPGVAGPQPPGVAGPQPPGVAGPQPLGVAGPQPPGAVGPQPPGAEAAAGAAQPGQNAPPVGPQPPAAQYGALDAENFMGSAPPETPWGQPKPRLSQDALSFAGRWQVAVIHRAGEARMLENAAEWLIELGRDGQFHAKQERDGQTWRQNGAWDLDGMKLRLHSGPGGERTFEVSQEMENLCVLREAGKETALFCVREKPDAAQADVQAKYDTDFGVLNLRPAGPGHWRGSYGEPPGELLLARLGAFLAGTWTQSPSRGFVLLELRPGGFAGGWLYQDSTDFDGRWVGVAAK